MVLMKPPPLRLAVAGRKYHCPLVQVIAHRLPHRFGELLFIARLYIILRNNVEPQLYRQSAVLVRFCDTMNVMARGSCRFLLVRLHRGRYLKYCYSIVKERLDAATFVVVHD